MKTVIMPHPVLLPIGTDYKEGLSFEIKIEKEPTHTLDGTIVMTVNFDLKSKFIENLIKKGKAKLYVVIKCVKTNSRRMLVKNVGVNEISLPLSEYFDSITLSSYVTTTAPISKFESSEHHHEFSNVNVSVPTGAILARASDKILKIDSLQTIKAAIRFSTENSLKDWEYIVDVTGDYINIFMNADTRREANYVRHSNDKALFPSLYTVTLIQAIQSIEEKSNKKWADALKKTLEGYGIKINDDLKKDAYKHVQKLLKYPSMSVQESNDSD